MNTVRSIKDTYLTSRSFRLSASEFSTLIEKATSILQNEPTFNRVVAEGETHVVGDLHGSLEDLARIISLKGYPSTLNKYIFNGDFVDRGPRSVEVLSIILAMKIASPNDVFLNRGNHEDHAVSTVYGFRDEIQDKYPDEYSKIWESVRSFYASLPMGTSLESSKLFTSHASPPLDPLINIFSNDTSNMFSSQKSSTLMSDDVDKRMVDMLWSDPDVSELGTRDNEKRGCGTIYGPNEVKSFCERHDLNVYVRSHECVMNGVEYISCGDDIHMYTVFSASQYPNFEGFNQAAVLTFKSGSSEPKVTQYESQELEFDDEYCDDDDDDLTTTTTRSLHKRIHDCREELLRDFQSASIDERHNRVSISQW